MRRIIGYTLGDQAGIGPEVLEKALASPLLPQDVEYRLIGERIPAQLGLPTLASAQAAFAHLELAAAALKDGSIDAVVTAPICKQQLHEIGFRWQGQTEFFAERLGCENFAMCLSGEHLTVGLASTHVALHDVAALLDVASLVRIGGLLKQFCQKKGIFKPRISLAALNPHAGENAAFGDEEMRVIEPAVVELQRLHQDAIFSGPSVPDCVYREAMQGQWDAILAPYHDQGLIPLKMVDFDTAVNITLGLLRPRLSPDHGTAFDIAGKGIASASSMLHALILAAKLA